MQGRVLLDVFRRKGHYNFFFSENHVGSTLVDGDEEVKVYHRSMEIFNLMGKKNMN